MSGHPPFNAQDVRRTLEIFCGGSVAEVRIINAFGSKSRTDAGYFSRYEIAAGAIAGHAMHPKNSGIYFVLNEFPADLQNRANNRIAERIESTVSDADITRRRWFFIDCDPKRPAGISSSEAEWLAARATADAVAAFLASRAFPAPILASSGNGWHLHYKIDVPNNDEATETIRNALREIANRFDNGSVKIDTKVFNAARVCKLYGTVSRKGDHSPERPHRVSSLERVPETIHVCDWSKIEALAAEAPKDKPKASRERSKTRPRKSVVDRAAAYLAKIPPAVSGESGHDVTFHAACVLVRDFDLSIEDALPILAEWNDRCSPPWSDRELLHKLQDADRAPGERGRALQSDRWEVEPIVRTPAAVAIPEHIQLVQDTGDSVDGRRLPKINITFDESQVAKDALGILGDVEGVFCDDQGLLAMMRDEGDKLQACRLSECQIRELLSAVCELFDAERERQVRCPLWLSKALLHRFSYAPVRHLRGIVRGPALRPTGTVIKSPGFDSQSGIFCDYDPEGWPEIPARPSHDDAVRGLRVLWDLVEDFEFASTADRAGWMAAILTTIGRRCIAGPAPLILVDAAVRGSGKSLLCDLANLIADNCEMPRSAWSAGDEAETRKKLSALLFKAPPKIAVLFDNVSGIMKSDALEGILTGMKWEDRVLGSSETRTVDVNTVFFASGNNVQLSADLARRVLRIRLEPTMECPEEREGFAIHDIRQHVRENRPGLLSGALTALSAFIQAGCPGADALPAWGSFQDWSRLIRGCITWAGFPDPAATRAAVRGASDAETEGLRGLLAMLSELDPVGHGIGCDELLAIARQATPEEPCVVRSALESFAGKPLAALDSRRLGNAFGRVRGRIIDGKRLDFSTRSGKRIWFLRGHSTGVLSGGSGGSGASLF